MTKVSPKKAVPVQFSDLKIGGWGVSEKELRGKIEAYIATLPEHFKKSFAALDTLLLSMSSGYDAHFMSLTDPCNQIHGLFAFNVDTMVQKQTDKQLKVNLYHISTTLPGDETFA